MDEEDLDFTPSSGMSSKLASLFGGISKPPVSGNSSLTYTAPKQPKKESSPSRVVSVDEKAPSVKLEVIISKVVQVYKLENGSYTGQGKLGITIVGSVSSHVYHIILYKGSKEHVSKSRITAGFNLKVSENNYVSYYDDNNVNWSVMFACGEDLYLFAKHVIIAKGNSEKRLDSILFQDLTATVGGASWNSMVELTCQLFYVVEDIITPVGLSEEESNICMLLSKNSGTPWVEGLIGCSASSKRIILVPFSCGAPWSSKVPSQANVLIEVHVSGVDKKQTDMLPVHHSLEDPLESSVDSSGFSAEESSIRARGASIKEALSQGSSKSHKASLISRMARMGQATLPVKGDGSQSSVCGPSDSEEDGGAPAAPKPRAARGKLGAAPASVALYQPQPDLWAQHHQLVRAPYPQVIQVQPSPITSPTADSLGVYLSESRTQAAELRMGMSKVADKVDVVLSKLQDMTVAPREGVRSPPQAMDPAGVLHSIQALVSDNQSLRDKAEEQRTKIEQQNDRIYQLLELNHKYLEEATHSKGRHGESEVKLLAEVAACRQREAQLEADRGQAAERVAQLQTELEAANSANSKLKVEVESLNTAAEGEMSEREKSAQALVAVDEKLRSALEESGRLKEANSALEERAAEQEALLAGRDREIASLKETNEWLLKEAEDAKKSKTVEEHGERKEAAEAIQRLKEEMKKLREENKALLQTTQGSPSVVAASGTNVVDEVKKVMNAVYRSLQARFDVTLSYQGAAIRQTLATTIRDITLEYIDHTAHRGEVEGERREGPVTAPPSTQVAAPTPAPAPAPTPAPVQEEKETGAGDATAVKETNPSLEVTNGPSEGSQEPEGDGVKGNVSYDQSWRPSKPPPLPLFDDEDEDDDWLA